MASHKLTTRFRRSFRRSRQQVEDIGLQAEEGLEQHIIERLGRLLNVKRFVAVWFAILLFLIGGVVAQSRALSSYYQTVKPVPGGVYSEGILGDFTNANPIYAATPVDNAVSKLIFASLFTFDDQNQLVGDLAESWSVDSTNHIYTVHLKPDLVWQDGQPLTADDVVFTYSVIQNPDAQSPLNASFQGVNVAKVDNQTVTFTLPDPLTAFPYSLTTGVIPKHLLGAISMTDMRSVSFNTSSPIGAGPFAWRTIEVQGSSPTTRQEEVALSPFKQYYAGSPKLSGFNILAFHDSRQMIKSFRDGVLDGMAGLDSLPQELRKDGSIQKDYFPLSAASMVFFKTTGGVLSDVKVRQALITGADINDIINGLPYPAIPVREPLLSSQIGFNPAYMQAGYNPGAAAQILQADGWIPGKGGVRYKDKQPLSFKLYTSDSSESNYVTQKLQAAWRTIGVDVQLEPQPDSDLQNAVAFHNYDALFYNISIGVDPDVFAYWDSSQANVLSPTRLNLSEYKSAAADAALEGARTRQDPVLRAVKLKPFLAAWQQDAPALGLYQPNFFYITREPVGGLSIHTINTATDRFNNVENWEARQAKVTD